MRNPVCRPPAGQRPRGAEDRSELINIAIAAQRLLAMGGTRRSNRVSVVPERLDYAEQAIKKERKARAFREEAEALALRYDSVAQ